MGLGGATAAVLALDTAIDESRKEMAKGDVARFPSRFSSGDGHIHVTTTAESMYGFLFSPLSFPFFLSCISLCFNHLPAVLTPVSSSPPCCFVREAAICPSCRYACRLLITAFLISLRRWYSVSLEAFLSYFYSCSSVLLVLLCCRTRYAGCHFTCFTHEFAII